MPIRVLIADDHAVVRQGLRIFLKRDHDLELVGEAINGQQAVQLARELHPDMVLMDLLMPETDGVEATARIRTELPDTQVIVLTSVLDERSIISAMRAGAIGYLSKDIDVYDLIRAIKSAWIDGQIQLSPKAAAQLMHEAGAANHLESLTGRELDVLRLLAQGQSNKTIANHLNIGEKTVKTHVSSILDKLHVTSRTQAALHAVRIGLVDR